MPRIKDLTISSGSANSESASLTEDRKDYELTSVIFNDTYTNTSFDLQISYDNGSSWFDVFDVFGSKVNISCSSQGKFALPADSMKDVDSLVRLNSPSATNEAADRTFKFVFTNIQD